MAPRSVALAAVLAASSLVLAGDAAGAGAADAGHAEGRRGFFFGRRRRRGAPRANRVRGDPAFHQAYERLIATRGSAAAVKTYQDMTDNRLLVAHAHRGKGAPVQALSQRSRADDEAAMLARRRRAMPSASGAQATCPRRPMGHSRRKYRGVAEIHVGNLTGASLKATIRERGAVIVRGLVPPLESAALVEVIDNVFDAILDERKCDGGVPRLCGAFKRRQVSEALFPKFDVYAEDLFVGSGIFAVQAPSATEHVLQLYQQLGVQRLLRAYFDDEPAVASKKMVLRRGNGISFPSWHQDGAFMAQGETYLNMWLSLSDCGANTGAAGLTMSPRRRTNLLRPLMPEAKRAYLSILLNHSAIEEERPVSPAFGVGDALIFDGYMVHTTQFDFGLNSWKSMRHAIETWFHPRCAINNGYSCPMAWGW